MPSRFLGDIDVDEQLRPIIEEARKVAAKGKLHQLFTQHYPGMISLIDKEYHYIYANGQALRAMGLTESSLYGKTLGFMGANSFTDQIRKIIGDALAGEKLEGELYSDGHVHAYMATPIRDVGGEIVAVLTHTWDITEESGLRNDRNKAIEKMELALQARTDFMAVAAHELRTPLATATGYMELMHDRLQKRNILGDDEQRYFSMVTRQLQKLSLMVSTLLDVTRIDRGVLTLDQKTMNLSETILRVVQEVADIGTIHTIRPDVPSGKQSIYINADLLRVEQVLRNILGNAIKYSPRGGDIYVHLRMEDEDAVIVVIDHGIGIPKEEQGRVLHEKFYRASNVGTVQTGITGFGIGLAVSREIVSMHGGELDVYSDGQDTGTTITITLPLTPKR